MSDTELREFCNQMIGKFKALSELQTEMQYETIDTKFTKWELKKLIFALDVLRITADRKTEPSDWKDQMWTEAVEAEQTEPSTDCSWK